MRAIIKEAHNVWASLTDRSRRAASEKDPLITELRRNEQDAWREVGKLRDERLRRPNPVEAIYREAQRRD